MQIHCKYDELVSLKDLRPHPKNPNRHPEDQIERLANLYRYHGIRHPIIVSHQSGLIVAGHGRLEAAIAAGLKEFPIVYQNFDSDDAEYAFLVSDNGIGGWSDLDLSMINSVVPELGPDFDVDMLGIKDFVLEPADIEGKCDEDEVPEARPEPKVKRGELWVLGNHRLLIDDCTLKENVERLMAGEKADMVFTDPPYGIDLDRRNEIRSGGIPDGRERRITQYAPIEGDNEAYDASRLLTIFDDVDEVFLWGGNNYCHTLPISSWVCWDRKGSESGDLSTVSDFELCWSKQRHKFSMIRVVWHGPFGHNKKTDGDSRVHPTQKPVKLAEEFFTRWGKNTKNIWDGYLGSGTTLIACEKTNRRCFGMEIDPHYGQVIIERWQKFTGKDAVREDGIKFKELA